AIDPFDQGLAALTIAARADIVAGRCVPADAARADGGVAADRDRPAIGVDACVAAVAVAGIAALGRREAGAGRIDERVADNRDAAAAARIDRGGAAWGDQSDV